MSDLYLETSALLRALLEGDRALGAALSGFDRVATSRLTFIEADRALSRAAQIGRMASAEGPSVSDSLLEIKARVEVVAIRESVCRRASAAFPEEPLRTLDALHLATALLLRDELGLFTIASCDARLRANAAKLGFCLVP